MFWRRILWGWVLMLLPIYLHVGFREFVQSNRYTQTSELYEQAQRDGQVPATSLEDSDWDRMCVATAYCRGSGDLSDDICDSFQEDGAWGPVFFKGKNVISIHHTTNHIRYKESKLCFDRKENPVFIVHERNMLTTVKGDNGN